MRLFITCLLLFPICALLAAEQPASRDRAKTKDATAVLDGMAAVVNGGVITFSQVRDIVEQREKALRSQFKGQELIEKIKQVRLDALNDLIDRELILQEFRKNKFAIPDYIVDEQVQGIIRNDFGGNRSAFMRTLEAQGYTLDKVRNNEREKIIVQAMSQRNAQSNLIIPPHKIDEYYHEHHDEYTSQEQVHLRMIVIKKDSTNLAESSLKMAEEIRQKIDAGADFGKMAEMYSEDSAQGAGGDWGWIDHHTLNETLTKTAFSLKSHKASRPIEMDGNVYLLFCEERKEASTKPLAQVRDDIEKKLVQDQRMDQRKKWLAGLRKKAYIKIY